MIPRFHTFTTTTWAADDYYGDGPEWKGRCLAVTWLWWTIEIAIFRKPA